MATALQQRAIFEKLASEYGIKIAAAFLMVVSSAANGASLPSVTAAIEAGDVYAIAAMLRLDGAGLSPVSEAIRAAYMAGGASAAGMISSHAVWGFDGSNPRAEMWVKRHAGGLVQGIEADTLAMLRHVVADGVTRGVSADKVAREIVGTKGPVNRTGGFIGLTTEQAARATRARDELEKLDGRYLQRALRDKTHDRAIRKALEDGTPLSQAKISQIVAGYRSRMLTYRGKQIARNEAHTALAAAQYEGFRQLIESGKVQTVTKRWQHNVGGQKEFRIEHVATSTAPARRFDEAFVFPDGAVMQYPHDPAGGAAHSLGCRCVVIYRPILSAE